MHDADYDDTYSRESTERLLVVPKRFIFKDLHKGAFGSIGTHSELQNGNLMTFKASLCVCLHILSWPWQKKEMSTTSQHSHDDLCLT